MPSAARNNGHWCLAKLTTAQQRRPRLYQRAFLVWVPCASRAAPPSSTYATVCATLRSRSAKPADNDNSRLFAPSVGTMLRKYGGNYEAAAKAHCGMIARVKHPNGKVVEVCR